MANKKIGFIGTGKMGEALIKGKFMQGLFLPEISMPVIWIMQNCRYLKKS